MHGWLIEREKEREKSINIHNFLERKQIREIPSIKIGKKFTTFKAFQAIKVRKCTYDFMNTEKIRIASLDPLEMKV